MHSLRELQAAFACAILEQDPSTIDGSVCGGNGRERLSVYAGNVYHNLREALRAVYPVVGKLVGERFFDFAANRYIHDHPSQSGDIQRFGYTFPTFLEHFPPAASLATSVTRPRSSGSCMRYFMRPITLRFRSRCYRALPAPDAPRCA